MKYEILQRLKSCASWYYRIASTQSKRARVTWLPTRSKQSHASYNFTTLSHLTAHVLLLSVASACSVTAFKGRTRR